MAPSPVCEIESTPMPPPAQAPNTTTTIPTSTPTPKIPTCSDEVAQLLQQFGCPEEFTEDEEKAMEELYKLIDEDEDMRMWRKYAQKNLLIVGLRACNLNAKQAFKSIKSLHHHATKVYPDLFAQVDPLNLKHVIEKKLFQVVKRPKDQGPALLVFRIKNWNPSEVNPEQLVLTAALYVYAVAKLSPEIQRQGLCAIVDISGFRFAHARQASVDLLVKAVRLYSSIPPVVKGIFVVNSIRLFETTFNMLKWTLPEYIRKSIHITRQKTADFSHIYEADRVPVEFGGKMADDSAYIGDIEKDILKDPMLFNLIKHLQDEILEYAGVKRK